MVGGQTRIQTARLLVVDDDENNRDMLSRRLARRGFDVVIAVDGLRALDAIGLPHQGVEARESCHDGRFDLILLDIEMPGLSGFDVLRRVRESHPPTRLPVVIATARSDREDVVQALGLGANDYVTKPLDFAVVLARVEAQLGHKRAVDRIVALEAAVRQQNAELTVANHRMRRSLEMAARVQRSLLPAPGPLRVHHVEFAWTFRPCDELGGDCINVFRLGGGAVGFYLLDVSGHGVPAALLAVTLSRMLTPVHGQSSVVEHVGADGSVVATSPAEVVAELNRRFPMGPDGGQYFTIFYGVVQGSTVRYVSAGHPPAVVARGDSVRPVDADGFAVGWFEDATFEESTIDLGPDDRLFVYSDGITEAMDPSSTGHFGGSGLAAAVAAAGGASLQATLDKLMSVVDEFHGPGPAVDDMTVLCMRVID